MLESSKPKKQRKSFFQRKLHLKRKNFAVHLNKELRKALGKRALELRKEDKVKIMRGSHKGFSGRVMRVNRRKNQVFLEKLSRKKVDGTEIPLPLQPSNLLLTELNRSDERRIKLKKKVEKPTEKAKEEGKKEKAAKEDVEKEKLGEEKAEREGERGKEEGAAKEKAEKKKKGEEEVKEKKTAEKGKETEGAKGVEKGKKKEKVEEKKGKRRKVEIKKKVGE